jgi:hypothetical protein
MNLDPSVDPEPIGTHLEQIARLGKTVTYGALVSQFGLPPLDGAWTSHPLSYVFELLDQQDAIAGRPFRTSVVVSAMEGRPGAGFFKSLERLRGVSGPNCGDAKQAAWIAELKAAHSYPWPRT